MLWFAYICSRLIVRHTTAPLGAWRHPTALLHPIASLGASNTCRPDADGNIYLLPFCELHLLFRPWLSGAEGKRERRRILVWVVPQQLLPLFVNSFPFIILLGNIVLSNIVDIVSLYWGIHLSCHAENGVSSKLSLAAPSCVCLLCRCYAASNFIYGDVQSRILTLNSIRSLFNRFVRWILLPTQAWIIFYPEHRLINSCILQLVLLWWPGTI